jgi:competence protein ComEC
MAIRTGEAPSTGQGALQTALRSRLLAIETWLEHERNQLPLWLPILFGLGIAAWFVLPLRSAWIAVILGGIAMAASGVVIGLSRRIGAVMAVSGLAIALGCAHGWARGESVTSGVLARPAFAAFSGEVTRVEVQVAKDGVRLTLTPDPGADLPPKVRVTVANDDLPGPVTAGDRVSLKARLVPPPEASVPAAYDFARFAWFQRIGATGKATGKIKIERSARNAGPGLRDQLSAHIRTRLNGSEAGIAAALATGDQGGVSSKDQDAMRSSGLAHLLSISGLHITAVVAAAMFLSLRLLALSQTLALRLPLLVVAAGVGALAGVGYTLLTGSEVPMVRSCIAALLVLIGLAMGREAMTLRLVATGALVVLIFWPESLVGPSFQLSFAAITALIALHELPTMQRWTLRREEGLLARGARALLSLLLTGLAVEVALAPIALFHFHKSGIYGALANIIAIPLTTFVIMPLEALALLFDLVGLGGPLWWMTGQALAFLLWLARYVADAPGAVAMLPSVPVAAYALILSGGLWLLLWRSKQRLLGLLPLAVGCIWAFVTPTPDLLITGDGRHMAVRGDDGTLAILRPRAGDYVRDMLAERSAYAGDPDDLDSLRGAQCSPDLCDVDLKRGGRNWRVSATRSLHLIAWKPFTQSCSAADIMVSERRLPKGCTPRWLKIDRDFLAKTGGLAITLAGGRVETVRHVQDDHPWVTALSNAAAARRAFPESGPDRGHNAAAHRRGWRDRDAPSHLPDGNI